MDGKTQIRKKTGKRPGLYLRVPSKESREIGVGRAGHHAEYHQRGDTGAESRTHGITVHTQAVVHVI